MILVVGPGTPAAIMGGSSGSAAGDDHESMDADSSSEDSRSEHPTSSAVHPHARTSAPAGDNDETMEAASATGDGNDGDDSQSQKESGREGEDVSEDSDDASMQHEDEENENNHSGDEDDEEGGEDAFDREFRRLTSNHPLSDAFQREALRLLRRRLRRSRRSRENDSDDDEDNEMEAEMFVRAIRGSVRRRRGRFLGDDDDDDTDEDEGAFRAARRRGNSVGSHGDRDAMLRPSLRHGGCINTACWLDRNWHLSTASVSSSTSTSAYRSNECPTQIVTSGDDKLVKVWSVSGAMGTDNPLPGGWNTFCPFADTSNETPDMSKVVEEWKLSSGHKQQKQGSVSLLATLSTGHRGNVFHVTPGHEPGKVLTCGADGYLRLVDMVSERSSVVVHPYVLEGEEDEMDLPFVFHSGMAYSHHLLTPNTGLLCSERGLHHFDLRLSPRQQARMSLLRTETEGGDFRRSASCKACAIWSPHCSSTLSSVQSELGSSYVFAGGPTATVCLYDLRMDGSRKRVVERYRPQGLDAGTGSGVSVSGLDVSRDGRELLVSYESDQIYSFPICHQSKSFHPSVEDIDLSCEIFEKDSDAAFPELASYGGHLNRFTFLKNARYAGPMDEYICTGSDSGHAWIYERKTGTVASLLAADSSTCNGVIPHPSLPFFITYGIDSTAKLWRATPPVDPYADDSPAGRAKCSLGRPYEMSPVTRTWDGVQTLLKHIDDEPAVMPDYIASSEEVAASGRFSSPCRRGILGGKDSSRFGNALLALPSVLRQNRYDCYRAYHEELDVPVSHPLVDFTARLSQARLRYQADRLGVKWDPWAPWALLPSCDGSDVHPADLVPDHPSDWINFDQKMRPTNFIMPRQQFAPFESYDMDLVESYFPCFFDSVGRHDGNHPWLVNRIRNAKDDKGELISDGGSNDSSSELLYETALLLKEGGNQAIKENLLDTAARRYDKAIQYCAVAFMRYFDGDQSLKLLTEGHHESFSEGARKSTSVIVAWSPLLRVLITSRLNMALLFLKSTFLQPDRAAGQARAALKLLAPFTVREKKVISVRDKKEYVLKEHEPVETFKEAQALQAKAYYRLGSAELEAGDYAAAIKSLESSLKCGSSDPPAKPDSLTVKRLQEAKRKHKTKKKRDRAKFQRMHLDPEPEGDGREEVGARK